MIEIIREKSVSAQNRELREAEICSLYKEIRDSYSRNNCPDRTAFETISRRLKVSISLIRLVLVKNGVLFYKKPGCCENEGKWVYEE